MAHKQKKKRTKQYRGADAAQRTSVTRVSAADRTALGQWWFERKKILKPILITLLVIAAVAWLIVELVNIAHQ